MPDRNDRHGAGASADALQVVRPPAGAAASLCQHCGMTFRRAVECRVEGLSACPLCADVWELLMTHGAGLPLGKPRLFLPGIDSTHNGCCPAWIDAVSFANASLQE